MSPSERALLFLLTTLAAPGCRPSSAKSSQPEAAASVLPPALPSPPDDPEARETVIHVDPARLSAFGLTLANVQATLISSGIPVVPDTPGAFILTAPRDMDAVLNTALATLNGGIVRLRDVASIEVRMPRR